MKGIEPMESYDVGREPQLVFEIAFSKARLTYISSDMGPERAIWPEPVHLRPGKGLWVLNRGENLTSWRLLRFNINGDIVFSIDLIEGLNISNPNEFIPLVVANDSNYMLTLLASRRFDFQKGIHQDFILAQFSDKGDLISCRELPGFSFDGNAYIMNVNLILNREKFTNMRAWTIYRIGGPKKQLAESALGNTSVAIHDGLIERLSDNEYRLLDANGKTTNLKYSGKPTMGSEPVRGDGNFFGYIRYGKNEFKASDKTNQVRRHLEVSYYEKKSSTILNLASLELLPNKSAMINPDEFILYRPGQACFDANGNFYEIAWSPSLLRVHRYDLSKMWLSLGIMP